VSDIENCENMLKMLKEDYDCGRYSTSEYLRMKNGYDTALKQAREREAGR